VFSFKCFVLITSPIILGPSLTGQLAGAGVLGVVIDVMRCHSSDSSVLLWAIKALANMTIDGNLCCVCIC